MKLEQFLPNISLHMEKNSLRETIVTEQSRLVSRTIPNWVAVQEAFKDGKFTNKTCLRLEKGLQVRLDNRESLPYSCVKTSKELSVSLGKLLKIVDTEFGDTIVREALTYARVTILQYIDYIGFYSKYSITLCDFILAAEAGANTKEGLTQFQRSRGLWLANNIDSFISVCAIIRKNTAKLEEIIRGIPERNITIDSISVDMELVGSKVLDPMGFGFITGRSSPIFLIRLAVVNFFSWMEENSKIRNENIRFRILYLKGLRSGHRDPILEKKIDGMENALQKNVRWLKRLGVDEDA